MKAVILAGGLGSRLGKETELMPKPMVAIGEQPILWHIMKSFSHYGVKDFIICLGYKGAVIKDYFANYALRNSDVTFNLRSGTTEFHQQQGEDWNVTLIDTGLSSQTGGRLKRVKKYLGKEPFFFTYGDGLADVNLKKLAAFHASHGKLATVTAVAPPGRWGVLKTKGARVTGFAEKVKTKESLINGGYFVLDPKVINTIKDDDTIWERDPLEKLTEQNNLRAFVHNGFWQCMDNPREKRDLEDMWNSGNAPWKVWKD